MSRNPATETGGRGTAQALALLALLLSLTGAIPAYGLIGSVAALIVGMIARARSAGGIGAMLALLAIYLGTVRIAMTLVAAFVFPAILAPSGPRHVDVPVHSSAPAKPGDAPKPNP